MYTICRGHKTASTEFFDFLSAKLISLQEFFTQIWKGSCLTRDL
jgi:hypothetical protein